MLTGHVLLVFVLFIGRHPSAGLEVASESYWAWFCGDSTTFTDSFNAFITFHTRAFGGCIMTRLSAAPRTGQS